MVLPEPKLITIVTKNRKYIVSCISQLIVGTFSDFTLAKNSIRFHCQDASVALVVGVLAVAVRPDMESMIHRSMSLPVFGLPYMILPVNH